MKKFFLTAMVAVLGATTQLASAECLSNYGQTACGYGCVANYGEVRCAKTPAGTCLANYGQVVCWDPSPRVRRAYRNQPPKAQCLANYGMIVCGYGCVANYGEVRCAATPQGECTANNGHVTCWDPEP